jgi:DNA repair photolyase
MDRDDSDAFEPERRYGAQRGRGAVSNPAGRFERQVSNPADGDDDWNSDTEASIRTTLAIDRARRVISYNTSPDIPFDRSLNPYRGCEHGCIYCYARTTHSYLDLSPGLDFETYLLYKPDAPQQLISELADPGYVPRPIALGVNTDAWQPVERRTQLTRRLLELLAETRHPVTLVTKSALVERDIDLLAEMAADGLVNASVSLTTLDEDLNRRLEPRAAGPRRRLRVIQRLSDAGVPVAVMLAPVIPGMTDPEMEDLMSRAAEHGATAAGWIPLRLPGEVEGLFADWLHHHYPDRCEHILSLVRQVHGQGRTDSGFGHRMQGSGAFADLLAQRFRVARRRVGLAPRLPDLDCTRFRPPQHPSGQLRLFE